MPRHRSLARFAVAAIAAISCSAPNYKPLTLAELTNAEGWIQFPEYAYRGPLRGGEPNGPGVARYSNGTEVRATFANGVPGGTATITVPRYGRIEGTLQAGQLVRGTAFLNGGGEYTGAFRDWAPNGTGRHYDPARGWFEGTFADGALTGQGTHYNPATNTQVAGTFADGRPDGFAVVAGPAGASGRYFDKGADITPSARSAVAARELAEQARADARRAEAEAQAKRGIVDELTKNIDRGEMAHTTAGIRAFNEACDLCNGGYVAYRGPDGRTRVRSGGKGCLIIEDRNTTAAEREASQRAYERRKAETMRACRAWANDIEDPAFPQRLASLRDRHRREGEALAASLARKRAADAAAVRFQQELAHRRYSEQVRQRAAEIEARQQRAAAEQAERLREERERCRTPRPGDCQCAKFRPPPPPPPPGSARACAA